MLLLGETRKSVYGISVLLAKTACEPRLTSKNAI